jgi:hypothetical protein
LVTWRLLTPKSADAVPFLVDCIQCASSEKCHLRLPGPRRNGENFTTKTQRTRRFGSKVPFLFLVPTSSKPGAYVTLPSTSDHVTAAELAESDYNTSFGFKPSRPLCLCGEIFSVSLC